MNAKYTMLSHFLTSGAALIQVDARACVGLPEHLMNTPSLVLRVGYTMVPPMNLVLDSAGVAGDFDFTHVVHHCYIPWRAVYAMHSNNEEDRLIFPDSMPTTTPERAVMPEPVAPKPIKPKLSLVP